MKRSLSILSVFVLLAVAMVPVQANAVVTLGNSPVPVPFATELIDAAPTVTNLTNASNALDASAPLGFSIAQGTSKYVRFDLSNGAKFGAIPTYVIQDDNNTPHNATATISQGGNGSSYVIFEVTSSIASINPLKVGTLQCATFGVVGPTAVTLTYALYANPQSAVSQSGALYTASGGFISFASGMLVGKNAVTPLKIDVLADSKKFEGGLLQTIIGSVYAGVNTAVHKKDGTLLVAADIALFVGANTALEVTGDFSATGYVAANVFFDDNTTSPCATGHTGTPATTLVAGKATFVVHQTPIANPTAVCMKVNGTTAIVPTTFYGLYNTDGGKAPSTNLDILSTLVKNSKALQSSWINATSANGKSQFYLTNMGSSDVQFTTKAFTEDGRTVTVLAPFNAPYAIKAGKSVVINVNSMLQWSGGNRFAAVVFEFLGSAANIQGAYRYYNYTTGMMVDEPLWQPYTD